MSSPRLAYVGTETGLRGRLAALLEATTAPGSLAVVEHVDDVRSHPHAPHLALVDVVGDDPATAVAAIGRVAVTWAETAVIAVCDDTSPATVRGLLDAGARTILRSTSGERQVLACVEEALEGRALIDVAIVRPVIDLYATLHLEASRRNRAVIESLAAAVEAKDSVTSRHLRRVSRLAVELARQVDASLASDEDFLFGCLLHDVGKIGVPERILMKPAALTEDEWDVMRRHPETGATVVRPLGLAQAVTDVVLYHHERWDGAGYPEGRAGDAIPLVARIFSVCDALEAMTAARPYRAPIAPNVAFERVLIEAGQQFDPEVIDALRRGVSSGDIDLARDIAESAEVPHRRISFGV